MKIIEFISKILDYIYYRKCYICSKKCLEISLCKDCLDKIYSSLEFLKLQRDNINIYSAAIYQEDLLKIIRALKYHRKREFSEVLANLIIKTVKNFNIKIDKYIICPVPIHKNRMKKRRYNHMELVGEKVAKELDIGINTTLITRIKDTQPLYKLSIPERKKAITGAFEVSSEIKNKRILLLDDIITSGTTVSEISKQMKEKGVSDIIIISATRAKSFL